MIVVFRSAKVASVFAAFSATFAERKETILTLSLVSPLFQTAELNTQLLSQRRQQSWYSDIVALMR